MESSQLDTPKNFILRPARLSDLSAIAQCWYHAFFDDEVIGAIMHPHRKQYPEDVYWFLLRGIRERVWDWRHQFIVIETVSEDTKKQVVGAADWRRVGPGGQNRELSILDPRNLIKPAIGLYHRMSLRLYPNRAADSARLSFLDNAVSNAEKHWTGKHAECWDLHVCGVHPDFQRKGIGTMLVVWGIQRADDERVSSSVLCGEKNRGFYRNAGLGEDLQDPKSDGRAGIALFRSAIPRDEF